MKSKKKVKKYAMGTPIYGFDGSIPDVYENMNKNRMWQAQAAYQAENDPTLNFVDGLVRTGLMIGGNALGGGGMWGNPNTAKPPLGATGTYAMGGLVPRGTQPNAEVEGNEAAQLPNGQMMNFQGASHEQGGMDVALPEATKIYSKRIKIDGVSMADRKNKRVKRSLTLEQLLNKNNTDALLKNAAQRTQEVNAVEEQNDMAIQDMVGKLLSNDKGSKKKYAYGDSYVDPIKPPKPSTQKRRIRPLGTPRDNPYGKYFPIGDSIYLAPDEALRYDSDMIYDPSIGKYRQLLRKLPSSKASPITNKITSGNKTTSPVSPNPFGLTKGMIDYIRAGRRTVAPPLDPIGTLSMDGVATPPKYDKYGLPLVAPTGISSGMKTQPIKLSNPNPNPNISPSSNPLANVAPAPEGGFMKWLSDPGTQAGLPTLGDALDIYGNYKQAYDPYRTTLENRAQDTPNINAYKNFGRDSLQTIEDAKQYGEFQQAKALQDLQYSTNAALRSGRNSAMGVNTLRALDLAARQASNKASADIYDNNYQRMQQILSMKAQMQAQRDQAVMQGEQARDLADRQDIDNYYNQLSENRANIGRGISVMGKTLNEMLKRKVDAVAKNAAAHYVNIDPMTGRYRSTGGDLDVSSGDFEKRKAQFLSGAELTTEGIEAFNKLNPFDQNDVMTTPLPLLNKRNYPQGFGKFLNKSGKADKKESAPPKGKKRK